MQLSQIRTRVRQRAGVSTGDSAVTDSVLTDLINDANRKISLLFDWSWLVDVDGDWTSLTAGQRAYPITVPEDEWRKTLILIANGNQQLRPVQPQTVHRYANITGSPRFYAVQGTTIYIAPTPDIAYDVFHVYVKEVATLVNDTDVPEIEDWAVDLLIDKAAILVARRLRDSKLRVELESEFAQTLDSMKDEVRRTRQLPKPQHRSDIAWS